MLGDARLVCTGPLLDEGDVALAADQLFQDLPAQRMRQGFADRVFALTHDWDPRTGEIAVANVTTKSICRQWHTSKRCASLRS